MLIAGLAIVGPLSLIANYLMWKRYRSDKRRPRSRFFAVMAVGSSMVNLGGVVIGWLALRSMLGAPPLTNGADIAAAALLVALSTPIFFYIMFIFLPDRGWA